MIEDQTRFSRPYGSDHGSRAGATQMPQATIQQAPNAVDLPLPSSRHMDDTKTPPTHPHSPQASAPSPSEKQDTPSALHRALQHSSVLSLLAFASIWGTLTRQGLVALNTYDGQSVTPLVWAQAIGCLIMGWAVGNRKAIQGRSAPVYTMLTTGYCGSVTTFSSWMLQVFLAFAGNAHLHHGGLHNVMDALSQTFVTLGMSFVSFYAGRRLAKFLDVSLLPSHPSRQEETSTTSNVLVTSLLLGPTFWIGSAIFVSLFPPYRHVTFSLIFSPLGAIGRWYLSRLNLSTFSTRHHFPLGTFTANIFAVLILSGVYTGQRYGRSGEVGGMDETRCYVLYGMQEGLCGCLSTISTFVSELDTISNANGGVRRAIRYVVTSYVVAMVVTVLLVGVPWWSGGSEGRCVGLTL